MTPAALLLAFVTMGRLVELWHARQNTSVLMSAGAIEFGAGHYPLLVVLHAMWLSGLWLIGWDNPVSPEWFAAFVVLQVLRVWILATLGQRWTTRIVVMPGMPLVSHGPYRFLSHPNYLVVVGEIAVLPLCLGLPWYAAAFSVANAAVLTVRIRAENAALAVARDIART
jgi:methyltransferase